MKSSFLQNQEEWDGLFIYLFKDFEIHCKGKFIICNKISL